MDSKRHTIFPIWETVGSEIFHAIDPTGAFTIGCFRIGSHLTDMEADFAAAAYGCGAGFRALSTAKTSRSSQRTSRTSLAKVDKAALGELCHALDQPEVFGFLLPIHCPGGAYYRHRIPLAKHTPDREGQRPYIPIALRQQSVIYLAVVHLGV
ncbi:uncharacterized protein BJX67DRAFT_121418 [Aspergillus lucknowensis]|uniref:Uncharacterized protein n=1 Tax=Aspergillus lucknowensis TaxID=176173 RepID=A0ABR4LQ75_9EURO